MAEQRGRAESEHKVAMDASAIVDLSDVDDCVWKFVSHLKKLIKPNGQLGEQSDIRVYFKMVTALFMAGSPDLANRVLDFVKIKFLMKDGDFRSTPDLKSTSESYNIYYGYTNGWLAMAAQRLGRFDISYPAYDWICKNICHPNGGSVIGQYTKDGKDNELDMFMTAHIAMVHLYFNNLESAKKCGDVMASIVAANVKNDAKKMYIVVDDKTMELCKDAKPPFNLVDADKADQLYFLVGYPMAALGKIYQATSDKKYLDAAEQIAKFALSCGDGIRKSNWAHKVAFGASVLFDLTLKPEYAKLAADIGVSLLQKQSESGMFRVAVSNEDNLDQSCEIVVWLKECQMLLNSMVLSKQ